MTVLFAGGENSEVDLLAAVMSTGGATQYRTTYARAAIHPTIDTGALHRFSGELAAYLAAQASGDKDFWYGFQWRGGGGALSGSRNVVTFYDSSASAKGFFQIVQNNTANCILRTSTDGVAWTSYPASEIAQPVTPTEHTFRIKVNASSGKLQWWIGGALWYEVTGDTASMCSGSPNYALYGHCNANVDAYFSEIVATSADDPRVGMNCATLYYTGNGHDTGWTGTYTDVSEVSEDTATVLTAASAPLDASFLHVNVPALTPGIIVRAVIPSGKWRTATTGSPPANLYGYLRIAGTNYANAPLPASIQAVPGVASTLQYIWHVSPATGLAFTEAEVNALEPGMRSAT